MRKQQNLKIFYTQKQELTELINYTYIILACNILVLQLIYHEFLASPSRSQELLFIFFNLGFFYGDTSIMNNVVEVYSSFFSSNTMFKG